LLKATIAVYEYEKALAVFEKLFEENSTNKYYYQQYLGTLVALKELDLAKQLIESQITKNPSNPSYYVDLGNIFKQQDMDEDAKVEFDKALQYITEDQMAARSVATTFTKIEEYDYAIATYEAARSANNNRPDLYLYEMAQVYAKKGDFDNTVEYYLAYSQFNPKNIQLVRNYFQRNLKEDDQYDILQKKLFYPKERF